jgi:hypothetical protein
VDTSLPRIKNTPDKNPHIYNDENELQLKYDEKLSKPGKKIDKSYQQGLLTTMDIRKYEMPQDSTEKGPTKKEKKVPDKPDAHPTPPKRQSVF